MSDIEKIFDDRKGNKCVISRCDLTSCFYNKNNQCIKPSVSLGRSGECKDYKVDTEPKGHSKYTYKR